MESLFIDELDGPTFVTREAATDEQWIGDSDGPTWSNYGGWVN